MFQKRKIIDQEMAELVSEIRPDFKIGYNTFGFDDKFIFNRIKLIDENRAKKKNIPYESLEDKFIDQILQILGKLNTPYIVTNEQIDRTIKN